MARHEVNPIEDWESEELSEEELDLLAGGLDPFKPIDFTGSVKSNPLDLNNQNFLGGDVVLLKADKVFEPAKVDSSYSSHLGAIGGNKNEASLHQPILPLNITNKFP
jgi:hypothetical protein